MNTIITNVNYTAIFAKSPTAPSKSNSSEEEKTMIIDRHTNILKVDVKLEDMIELDVGSPCAMQVSIHPNSVHQECYHNHATHPDDDGHNRHVNNIMIVGPTMEQELREFASSDCQVLYSRALEMLDSLQVEYIDLMRVSFRIYDGIIKHILANYDDDKSNIKYVFSVEIKISSTIIFYECVTYTIPATASSIRDLEIETVHSYDDDDQYAGFSPCTICLENIGEGNAMAWMPCKHGFHDICIKRWLTTSHYCPLCRFEMPVN